ncbi:fosfomycin resistance glutathione transferase [Paraliomyxa miuraensis]|uniref:fosfomycin resistance glutathione transferase n=1 Tax=Paraliomyxa miuraensis TaxID=376150 RepID=UPI00224DBB13|nr:fosfomycin resistance glutathione transferase [Paraliomyxa miuraensis]MCX4243343.1 fosfomycin resistance glutathione transferase [Paraliomyxa miuraensis]
MITAINHVTLAVADLDRSLRFYVDVLGCHAMARWVRGAYLEAGTLWLCLSLDVRAEASPATGGTHLAFSVDADRFETLRDRILTAGARQWQDDRSEGPSLYFEDPDGHRLEIHVGDLRSRLAACRQAPYEGMEFLDRA